MCRWWRLRGVCRSRCDCEFGKCRLALDRGRGRFTNRPYGGMVGEFAAFGDRRVCRMCLGLARFGFGMRWLDRSWAVREPPLRDRAFWCCVVDPYVVEQGARECRACEAVDVWLDSDWHPTYAPEECDAEVVVEDGLFDLRV